MQVASTPFKKITYTEAIEILEKAVKEGKKFEYAVRSGGERIGQRGGGLWPTMGLLGNIEERPARQS